MRKIKRNNVKSIRNFPSLARKDDTNLAAYMFIEDVHLAIMPIGGRTEKHPKFTVNFKGNAIDCERAKYICSSLADYERYDSKGLLSDVVNEIALHLAWFGRVAFEIVQDNDDQKQISLHAFTTKKLYKICNTYIQWVPKNDFEFYKKKFVFLPSKDVWEITMPQRLGGRKGYSEILSSFERFPNITPEFWLNDLQAQKQYPYFNFEEYVDAKKIYNAQITRLWGWNLRDTSLKNNTEFWYFYRTISFKWTQAVLREHILNELNLLFTRLHIDAKIVIEGLPTSTEILNTRQELLDGKIHFGKAYEQSSL